MTRKTRATRRKMKPKAAEAQATQAETAQAETVQAETLPAETGRSQILHNGAAASQAPEPGPQAATLLSALAQDEESLAEIRTNRPLTLQDFVGQGETRRRLSIFLRAAAKRGEPIDHTILMGPPGLGKTTLAAIIANEMGASFLRSAAPNLTRPQEVVSLLMSMEPNTLLFIDEVHRLTKPAAEMLYTAMEDFRIDILVGEGAQARNHSCNLPPFTLVGATTRPGALPGPLLARFGIPLRLEYYSEQDLVEVLVRDATKLGIACERRALFEIASRARGTPRIAKRLLRRVRDVIEAEHDGAMTPALVVEALTLLGIDANGLDELGRNYLETLAKHYHGGPVGIETMAAALSEDRETLETELEPYLMSRGFLQRTPRGRALTRDGYAAAGYRAAASPAAGDLFSAAR